MYLHHHWVNSNVCQVFGAIFFAWSFVLAALLFVYWTYAAFQLLTTQGAALTDAELNLIHWSSRRRFIGRRMSRAQRLRPRWFPAL